MKNTIALVQATFLGTMLTVGHVHAAPIIEYRFNEVGGTAINTGTLGAAGDGTLNNALRSAENAPFDTGASLSLNGVSSFVRVRNNFSYGSQVTIEAWIKPAATDHQRVIWDDYGNPGVLLAVVNGSLQFNISTAAHPGLGIGVVTGCLTPNVWQHVAGVYDGATLRVFINGRQAAGTATTSGAIIENLFDPAIGADNMTTTALNFAGLIDDFRIHTQALSAGQLAGGVFPPDNPASSISCPPDVSASADPGQCFATAVNLGLPTSSGNCAIVSMANDAPAQFPVGETIVNWTVTDASGLIDHCEQRVTVRDNEPPFLTCPADIVAGTNPGQCSAVVSFAAAVTDNCPGVTITYDHAPGSIFSKGATAVAVIATDASGNSSSCSFNVTVNDTESPVMACPADVTLNTDAGQCFASGVTLNSPAVSDNCGFVTVSSDAPTTFAAGTTLVTWTAIDSSGVTFTCQQRVTVIDDQPPTISLNGDADVTMSQGTLYEELGAVAADNCDGSLPVTIGGDVVDSNVIGIYRVTYDASDSKGQPATQVIRTIRVVENPVLLALGEISISPNQVNSLGTTVTAAAPVSYSGTAPLSVELDWGDGTASSGAILNNDGALTAQGNHGYAVPGVFTITLTVADGGGATAQAFYRYVVIFDPDGGFVTGGGWINSPAGAYTTDLSLTGKANFGFIAKYLNGANVPTGNTEFQFKAGNLNFHSTSYDWLVVSGAKAKYKGSGTINGAGDYAFQLSAIDGEVSGGGGVDKFRIKIWGTSGGGVIYDNQPGDADTADATTALAGGNIVVHK